MTSGTRSSPLLIRGNDVLRGDVVSVKPNGSTWRYIDFRVARLAVAGTLHGATGSNELVIVVVAGTVQVVSGDHIWKDVGVRPDPFSSAPAAIYLPASTDYQVVAASRAEIALCAAPARGEFPARLIAPSSITEHVRGRGHAERRIRDILMKDDAAGSLFLTEVITPPGNWSSYPPHKHDVDDLPNESQLEELYFYHARPAAGFAFQRIYDSKGEFDETITAHDNDVVLVPRGYHVCAAAAEYSIYYLNVLAGPKHVYRMTFDPAHAWIKENWTW